MTKRRTNISVLLMLLAIVAVVSFQLFWLYKTFLGEEDNLRFRTSVLFREAMQQVQADMVELDSKVLTERFRNHKSADSIDMIPKGKVRDLIPQKHLVKPEIASSKNEGPNVFADFNKLVPDSLPWIHFDVGGPGENGSELIKVSRSVGYLYDSITVKDVSAEYSKLLHENGINLSFVITRRKSQQPKDHLSSSKDDQRNEITLGTWKPVTFNLKMLDTGWYSLKKMSSQILMSFLVVGLTIFSFLMLWRNLIQQQKLTNIKNDFISNITHELKTPITTVSVAIEALSNFNALHDQKRTREYLEISTNELQRLSLLVDNVLKLSMFEKQQIQLRKEQIDLLQLVEEVLTSMKPQLEKSKAMVSVNSEGIDFTIVADRLHFTSVIFNLLDNALKYSKADPRIDVHINDTGACIELAIADNGIGIPSEFRKKIFDKFFRVPTGNKHNIKGYGLGLSYVAYVVQRHQGTIELESQFGVGSRFIIKLIKPHE